MAASWWYDFLAFRPPKEWMTILSVGRSVAWYWTDAAGVSRGFGAVKLTMANGVASWSYVMTNLPQEVWDQLLDRSDAQISYQEFAAVVLAFSSFLIEGQLAFFFIDNNAVLLSILKGSAKSNSELNLAIGRFWLDLANNRVAPFFLRVESKANIADAPSRDSTEELERLGAVRVEPIFPPWFSQVWSFE